MICSSLNLDRFIVRLLQNGLYPNLEEFQGLRSLGVPVTIKDLYWTADQPTRSGSHTAESSRHRSMRRWSGS
jgi:hypothetical protein